MNVLKGIYNWYMWIPWSIFWLVNCTAILLFALLTGAESESAYWTWAIIFLVGSVLSRQLEILEDKINAK